MNDNFINIKFQNNGKYDEKSIHSPIIFGDKAVGFITDVNEDTVEGLLWAICCDFKENLDLHSGSVISTQMIIDYD